MEGNFWSVKFGAVQAMLTSLSLARARFSGSHPEARCLCLAESSSSESHPSVGPGGMGQRRRMLRFSLRKRWHKKQSKPGEVSASIELPGLSGETQQQPEQQPQGRPSRWKERWRRFRRRFRRREEAEDARREEAEEASGGEDASAGAFGRGPQVLGLFLCACVVRSSAPLSLPSFTVYPAVAPRAGGGQEE